MLYGVHVMMNERRMAESVLAALVSCFFSCVFFFFGCFDVMPLPASCFGIILALRGILTSCMCEVLLVNVGWPAGCKFISESPLVGLKCGLVLFVGGDSSDIILIVGLSESASGSLMSMV